MVGPYGVWLAGWAGYGLYQGLNLAIPIGFLKFSRDAEREADYLGLQANIICLLLFALARPQF